MRWNLVITITVILAVLDIYTYFALRNTYFTGSSRQTLFGVLFWLVAILSYIILFWSFSASQDGQYRSWGVFMLSTVFILLCGKLLFSSFLLIDDVIRGVRWLLTVFQTNPSEESKAGVSRLNFLVTSGVLAGTGIIAGLSYGIARGAHNYRIARERIHLPHLPKAFEGLKILQISDIHSGSFWNKRAVERGVRMIMEQKPDVVFFTGDIVNNLSHELEEYKEVFGRISAPHGVYSILGNHDYAEYVPDLSDEERQKSIREVIEGHKEMGWDILLNENRFIERDGERIAVIGIENWSAHARFPKYGDLHKAFTGVEETAVKLLLSHDPSHWRAQVIPEFSDIDITFSGHTHGMQFGVETGGFKWSPVQYMYPEWAGLYQEKHQYLYVNRGFGYIGYPGRLGIRPEITIIELTAEG